MKLELTQKLRQQQILAPQMILSMDILLLTNLELENRIQEEFMSNPALEMEEASREGAEAPTGEGPASNPSTRDLAQQEAEIFAQLESIQHLPAVYDFDPPPSKSRSGEEDRKLEALANVADKPEGLSEHLIQQARLLSLTPRVLEIAENLIQNLDGRGYLLSPPEEIRTSLGAAEEEFREGWSAVRGLDPAGVGAVDLPDCLILQLERDRQDYRLEIEIIRHHLEDLRLNRLPKIARDLGRSVEEVKEALEIISLLQPHPGNQYDSSPTFHVRPEVVVEKVNGKFEVKVDDEVLPRLKISDSMKGLLKTSRGNPEVGRFVRKKIESAQWIIQAIQQRQRTLSDISRCLVEYQREFMEHGPVHLRAMKMQTIADTVGVHISTISRAIKGKYVQTPWGTFELRFFFTGGVERADGQLESRRNIYREIEKLIKAEDKHEPLSDSDLARILKAEGLNIARRTVTKYREQEGIPPSRLRKQY